MHYGLGTEFLKSMSAIFVRMILILFFNIGLFTSSFLFHRLSKYNDVRLVLLGGVRGAEDEALVSDLRQRAKAMNIDDNVDFMVNADFPTLERYLRESAIGLHRFVGYCSISQFHIIVHTCVCCV